MGRDGIWIRRDEMDWDGVDSEREGMRWDGDGLGMGHE